jgi:hypothetical protein
MSILIGPECIVCGGILSQMPNVSPWLLGKNALGPREKEDLVSLTRVRMWLCSSNTWISFITRGIFSPKKIRGIFLGLI